MQTLIVSLHHDQFRTLSDRSARQILKDLSKRVREAQRSELKEFIYSLDLPFSTQRSIEDIIKDEAKRFSPYELQRLEKGSLFVDVVVAVGLVLYTLKLLTDRIDDDPALLRRTMKRVNEYIKGEYATNLAERLNNEIAREGLGNHLELHDSEVVNDGDIVRLDGVLGTSADEPPPEEPDTPETVQQFVDEKLNTPRRRR